MNKYKNDGSYCYTCNRSIDSNGPRFTNIRRDGLEWVCKFCFEVERMYSYFQENIDKMQRDFESIKQQFFEEIKEEDNS